MAPPIKSDHERKTPYAVSLSKDERAMFQYLGGSPYLQGHLQQAAERIVHNEGVKPMVRKAAERIIQAHVNRGVPARAGKLTALQEDRGRVLAIYPQAVCARRREPGGGVTYGVYVKRDTNPVAITKGWMTPAQAWERAVATIQQPRRA